VLDDEAMRLQGWRGGDGNAAYLDKTLRHHPMELSLDDSVSWSTLRSLWIRGFVVSVGVWTLFAVVSLLTGGLSSGAGLFAFGTLLSFLAFWVVVLFSRLQEPIAEWRVLLADRGDAMDATYSQIRGTLRDQGVPIEPVARRMRTGFGSAHVSDRLVLTEGAYIAHVSVFDYGRSLYLGWMMWRVRPGAALIGRFLSDVIGGILGRTDLVGLMLRTERPRAMREAVHAACRQGLVVAVEGRDVPWSYGFPDGLPPIEDSPVVGQPAQPTRPVRQAAPAHTAAGGVTGGYPRPPAAGPRPPADHPQPYPPQPPLYPGQAPLYPGQAQPHPGQAQPYPGQAQPYPGQAQPYPGQAQQPEQRQ
jgi:hypothetical protein